MDQYWGHSKNENGLGTPEILRDHVMRVRSLSRCFGKRLGWGSLAEVAADLHDLGKYTNYFNRYVRGQSGLPSRDHWTVGARVALALNSSKVTSDISLRESLSIAIEAHHGELQSLQPCSELRDRLDAVIAEPSRVTSADLPDIISAWKTDGFTFPQTAIETALSECPAAAMLETRMLYSCLVDADYLATEGHFNGDRTTPYRPRLPLPSFDFDAAAILTDKVIGQLPRSPGPMQQVRNHLRTSCLDAAQRSPGCYTLAAPTGAGKTLSMLSFALNHAAKHQLQRIIIVMPFLSIVEQTARVIRETLASLDGFHPNWVLEDHSLADAAPSNSEQHNAPEVDQWAHTRRLLAENWDAPIVLTSSVKCLESLHASRPRACRKLHRLAGAVILFDEVQTIPPSLAVPTLATLSHLSKRFNSTVVFATATQPAFELLDPDAPPPMPRAVRVRDYAKLGWKPGEIVADSQSLFDLAADRVQVTWHLDDPLDFNEIANRMTNGNQSSLAIVNLKRHAAELFSLVQSLDSEARHMSTAMCAAHRGEVLDFVNRMRKSDRPVQLVSTQCVEAGVDFSFERVYRAFAPLESIAQAAGRCNRSGELPDGGQVHVYNPDVTGSKFPSGYGPGIQTLETLLQLLREEGQDISRANLLNDVSIIRRYYALLYSLTDKTIPTEKMHEGMVGLDFPTVASEYCLIPDQQISILVPYDNDHYDQLIERFEDTDRSPKWARDWFRDARAHVVGIYRHQFKAIENYLQPLPFGPSESRDPDTSQWWFLSDSWRGLYKEHTGLEIPEPTNSLFA
ncbi:CRISPR-associated endonuclease Cas3'' [Neorhodopirellula lusitana]|uniref:CRISPR-associated endonuclease Cas3'' n=1 Tax=Neorhodopirellula lusitana TaxID=445327 RepID=UPI00384DC66A